MTMNRSQPVNVLFITADQLRYDSLGITGHPLVRTPHLDQLARSGALFTDTFVQSAVCAPSRACMYTGRYTHNNGVRFNEVPFRPGEKTIADYFKEHDYRAALVGRTHFTPITEKYGFEYFAYYDGLPVKDGYSAYPEYLKRCGYSDDDIRFRYWPKELEVIPGQEAYPVDFREAYYPSRIAEEHSDTAYLTNEAIRFIEETGDQPWMLHLSYWKPHLPFSVSEPYHSMYDPQQVPMPKRMVDELDSKPPLQKLFSNERRGNFLEDENLLRQIRAVYYGMITQLDDHIGRLLAELDARGLRENTMIVFTSDHGEYMGDHHMVEKELFYEQAIHVPLIMSMPGRIPPGLVIDSFVETVDFLPTCMEAAELAVPRAVDGRSVFPLIDGTAQSWRQEVFAEWDFQYYHVRGQLGLNPEQCKAVMVRNRRWKYIHYSDQPCELYDLENDPDEFRNLAEDPYYREVRDELLKCILDWRLRSEDKTPEVDLTFASYLRDPWSNQA
jgi:arylsulfatase A-like enzyme